MSVTTSNEPALIRNQQITIRGARANNLKSVDCDIPLNQLVVFAGPSGSGKSSLIFDVLWHEAKRRYWETQQVRSEQFQTVQLPTECDSIGPLPPMIAVTQRLERLSQWQTVGDLTDLSASFRVLFASLGRPHCPRCGIPLNRLPAGEIVESLMQLPERTKLMLMAPVRLEQLPEETTAYEALTRLLENEGMVRVKLDGQHCEWSDVAPEQIKTDSTLAIVVDRLILKAGIESRLRESLEVTLRIGGNECLVESDETGDWSESIYRTDLRCRQCATEYPVPSVSLLNPRSAIGACLKCEGTGLLDEGNAQTRCPECRGARLNDYTRAIRWRDWTYPQWQELTISQLTAAWDEMTSRVSQAGSPAEQLVLQRLTDSIENRLRFLDQVGVGYLQPERTLTSLSQGELQRCRLAAALGVGLSGVCYLLDEPSVGLHPADVSRLKLAFEQLLARGNSVLCVEHDRQLIQAANHLILLGPGGGHRGGTIVGFGTVDQLIPSTDQQPTSHYSNSLEVTEFCELKQVSIRNLSNLTVRFPLHQLTTVTGVSGSGKSTLCFEALQPAVRELLQTKRSTESTSAALTGADSFQRLVSVGHVQFGDSSRSMVLGALKLLPELRSLFAKTKQAKLRGFSAKRFSLEHPSGRCPRCNGTGQQPGNSVAHEICLSCMGKRFNRQTLSVTWKGHSFADLLAMTLDELADEFASISTLARTLQSAVALGLGYLQAGEPTAHLSGGERQRILIARAFHDQLHHSLILLDEPTTGLSRIETDMFVEQLSRLIEHNNTIVTITHDLQLVRQADWVIDLGPGGGPDGGTILYQGVPSELYQVKKSRTGEMLATDLC